MTPFMIESKYSFISSWKVWGILLLKQNPLEVGIIVNQPISVLNSNYTKKVPQPRLYPAY